MASQQAANLAKAREAKSKAIKGLGHPSSRKFREMLEAFTGKAQLDLTEACRLAGYRHPAQEAWKIKKRYAKLIEQKELEFRKRLAMDADEATERMAAIARNPKHKDHYNAVKTLLTMHGKLDTSLKVTLNRSELNTALDEVISQLAESKQATEESSSLANPLPEPVTEAAEEALN